TATNSSGGVAEKTILLTVKNTDSSFIAVPSKDDNKNKPAKNIPKTGDTLNTELIVMGMMLLLVGGWMFLRRKTKVKTK
ncbi:LPXTG cell wall anchor domain-containing protein, partial [Listeria monocytogenes]|nr:LPXTG cell wall anchor domain-containing protein [Listeria monocytogenes]